MDSLKVKALYQLLQDVDFDENVLRDLAVKTAELLQEKINRRWRNHYQQFLHEQTQDLEELLANSKFGEDEDVEGLSWVGIDNYIIDNEFTGIAINHGSRLAGWWTGSDELIGPGSEDAKIILTAHPWNQNLQYGQPVDPPGDRIIRYAVFLFRHRS